MPKKVGTTHWRKQRRKEYLEKKEYRYYIFCEGEQTEPLYFKGFKQLIEDNPIYKDMVLIEIEPCAAETMRVIGMAERYVRKKGIDRGQIWCVLHYAYYTSNNYRSEYIKFLNDKFRELGIEKYQKNRKDIFNILIEKGNPKLAIRYAKRIIEGNWGKTPSEIAPGTKVYKLVEELVKYLPEDIKQYFREEYVK